MEYGRVVRCEVVLSAGCVMLFYDVVRLCEQVRVGDVVGMSGVVCLRNVKRLKLCDVVVL